MKKITVGLFIILALLSACGAKEKATPETEGILNSYSSESKITIPDEPTEKIIEMQTGDTFTTLKGDFVFTGQKEKESIDGLSVVFLEFDYTNTTNELQNLEYLLWDFFDAKQILTDTTETLSPIMLMDDDESYERYEKTQVEINPGSTVQAGYGYILNDKNFPMTLDLRNENKETVMTRVYELE